MRNKIYYAGFYDLSNSERMFAIPAVNKMDYIISALNDGGFDVSILSPSFLLNNRKYKLSKGGIKQINKHTTLWLPPSLGLLTKLGKYISAFFSFIFWFFKLIQLTKNDTLIVYHTPVLFLPINIAKKIKNFTLILEVEEVYTIAFKRDIKKLKKEIEIIKSADKYILVNDIIANKLNIDLKPHIVCYGPYKNKESDNCVGKFNDGKTHIVYAGSFSELKGGAIKTIESALYLPSNYVVHILGFGSNNEVNRVVDLVKEVNGKANCHIVYEGKKTGVEYVDFMKRCHIGINTQAWGEYMTYAYPSKVVAYMNMGLSVVTSPLKTLKMSSLDRYYTYTESEEPDEIANTIIHATIFEGEELKEALSNLHESFTRQLKQLIES